MRCRFPAHGRRRARHDDNSGSDTPGGPIFRQRTAARFAERASGRQPVRGLPDRQRLRRRTTSFWLGGFVGGATRSGVDGRRFGAVYAVLRHNGASGDVATSASAPTGFQVVGITWGPAGVDVFRNGEAIGTNQGIDSVSSDPAITALTIGGPGSGSSPRFHGDLAELRVYALPVDDPARVQIETELKERWCAAPGRRAAGDPVVDLYDELVSPQGPFRVNAAERDKLLSDNVRARLPRCVRNGTPSKRNHRWRSPAPSLCLMGAPPERNMRVFMTPRSTSAEIPPNPGKTVPRGFPQIPGGRRSTADSRGERSARTGRLADATRQSAHARGSWSTASGSTISVSGWCELRQFRRAGRTAQPSGTARLPGPTLRAVGLVGQSDASADDAFQHVPAKHSARARPQHCRRSRESAAGADESAAARGRGDSRQLCSPWRAGWIRRLRGPAFTDVATPRRSLYLMSVRTGAKAADFGPLFDGPDCSAIVERRKQSTVAPQALFLMNDPFVLDLAAALAERIAREIPRISRRRADRVDCTRSPWAVRRPGRGRNRPAISAAGQPSRRSLGPILSCAAVHQRVHLCRLNTLYDRRNRLRCCAGAAAVLARWRWRRSWPTSRCRRAGSHSGELPIRWLARTPAFSGPGKAGDLPVHAGRPVASRYLRSQAAVEQDDGQPSPKLYLGQQRNLLGSPWKFRPAWPVGNRGQRIVSAYGEHDRRPVRDPLDGHRRPEPSRRLPADEHGRAGLFAAEPGRLGHVRLGNGKSEPARLRRHRPWTAHRRAHGSTAPVSCRPPTRERSCRTCNHPLRNLKNPQLARRSAAARVGRTGQAQRSCIWPSGRTTVA